MILGMNRMRDTDDPNAGAIEAPPPNLGSPSHQMAQAAGVEGWTPGEPGGNARRRILHPSGAHEVAHHTTAQMSPHHPLDLHQCRLDRTRMQAMKQIHWR